MTYKRCSKCGVEKPHIEFNKHSSCKDGIRPDCKECVSKYKKIHRAKNKVILAKKSLEYREKNVDKLKEVSRLYYVENKVVISAKAKVYREENKGRTKESNRLYRERSPEEVSKYREEYKLTRNEDRRNRYRGSALYNMECRIRSRISGVTRNEKYKKSSRTCEIVGCSWKELIDYLEIQFVDGMGWENRSEWHIDHIIPLSSAANEEELIKLCHYTNLQPLWAADNLSKGSKIL